MEPTILFEGKERTASELKKMKWTTLFLGVFGGVMLGLGIATKVFE